MTVAASALREPEDADRCLWAAALSPPHDGCCAPPALVPVSRAPRRPVCPRGDDDVGAAEVAARLIEVVSGLYDRCVWLSRRVRRVTTVVNKTTSAIKTIIVKLDFQRY